MANAFAIVCTTNKKNFFHNQLWSDISSETKSESDLSMLETHNFSQNKPHQPKAPLVIQNYSKFPCTLNAPVGKRHNYLFFLTSKVERQSLFHNAILYQEPKTPPADFSWHSDCFHVLSAGTMFQKGRSPPLPLYYQQISSCYEEAYFHSMEINPPGLCVYVYVWVLMWVSLLSGPSPNKHGTSSGW